jgi:hypothetical protein
MPKTRIEKELDFYINRLEESSIYNEYEWENEEERTRFSLAIDALASILRQTSEFNETFFRITTDYNGNEKELAGSDALLDYYKARFALLDKQTAEVKAKNRERQAERLRFDADWIKKLGAGLYACGIDETITIGIIKNDALLGFIFPYSAEQYAEDREKILQGQNPIEEGWQDGQGHSLTEEGWLELQELPLHHLFIN